MIFIKLLLIWILYIDTLPTRRKTCNTYDFLHYISFFTLSLYWLFKITIPHFSVCNFILSIHIIKGGIANESEWRDYYVGRDVWTSQHRQKHRIQAVKLPADHSISDWKSMEDSSFIYQPLYTAIYSVKKN